MQRLRRALQASLDTLLFRLCHPYARGVKVVGLSRIRLPWPLSIGSGSRLLAWSPRSRIAIGRGVWIGRDVEIAVSGTDTVIVKDRSSVQDRCKLQGTVTIERDAILAPNVFISSGTHEAFRWPTLNIRGQDKRAATEGTKGRPCHIEEDVWIGVNTFVRQGVYIGRGAVIGANSVVLKDVRPYDVIGGIPAKSLKERLEFSPPAVVEAGVEASLPYLYRGISRTDATLDETAWLVLRKAPLASVSLTLENLANAPIEISLVSNAGETASLRLPPGKHSLTPSVLKASAPTGFPAVLADALVLQLTLPRANVAKFVAAKV